MRVMCVCFVFGLVSAYFLSLKSCLAALGVLALLSLLLRKTTVFWCLVVVFAGTMRLTFALLDHHVHAFPASWQKQSLTVTGEVLGDVKQQQDSVRFSFRVEKLDTTKIIHWALPAKVLLHWYHHPKAPRQGQHLTLKVKLKKPHGFHDPGVFNYARWLMTENIVATGYVAKLLEQKQVRLHSSPLTLTERYRNFINSHCADSPVKSFLLALALGDRRAITARQWRVLQNTGTAHLVAISGLHLSLLAAGVYFLFQVVWLFIPWCQRRFVRKQVGIIPVSLFAVGYYFFTGQAISTLRATVMITVVMLARWRYRRLLSAQVISTAVLFICVLTPLAILRSGFWLSVSAVSLLALMNESGHCWSSKIKLQMYWFIGLAPVLLWLYGKISLVAFFCNGFAIPLVAGIGLPLLLVSLIGLACHLTWLATLLLHCANTVITWVWGGLVVIAHVPGAVYWHSVPLLGLCVIAVFALVTILTCRYFTWQIIAVFCYGTLLLYQLPSVALNHVRLTVLEVGQGLSVVVQTKHHVLVYDTGPKFSEDFDAGSAVLLPFLRFEGIARVNTLVVSHRDNDHIGGANALLRGVPVDRVLTSVPKRFKGWPVSTCLRGQHWHWDGVAFRVLYPTAKYLHHDNNSSCVLKVSSRFGSVLLTGDIEKKAEFRLIKLSQGRELMSEWLIAPHHGSKTSSSWRFLQAVSPKKVVFATGFQNRFHFPNALIVKRYRQFGATAYDTKEHGAVSIAL